MSNTDQGGEVTSINGFVGAIHILQFNGKNHSEICKFVGKENMVLASSLPYISIITSDDTMEAHPNDWIIKDAIGRLRSCKSDILKQFLNNGRK